MYGLGSTSGISSLSCPVLFLLLGFVVEVSGEGALDEGDFDEEDDKDEGDRDLSLLPSLRRRGLFLSRPRTIVVLEALNTNNAGGLWPLVPDCLQQCPESIHSRVGPGG